MFCLSIDVNWVVVVVDVIVGGVVHSVFLCFVVLVLEIKAM